MVRVFPAVAVVVILLVWFSVAMFGDIPTVAVPMVGGFVRLIAVPLSMHVVLMRALAITIVVVSVVVTVQAAWVVATAWCNGRGYITVYNYRMRWIVPPGISLPVHLVIPEGVRP